MNGVEIEVKAQVSRNVVELANVRVPLTWQTQQNETGMQHLLTGRGGPRLPYPPHRRDLNGECVHTYV